MEMGEQRREVGEWQGQEEGGGPWEGHSVGVWRSREG